VSKLVGGAGVIAALGLAMGFASLNSGQRVTLRLGFFTAYGVPLTVVAFGSVLAGMMVMLVAGVRSDLKVRGILRARLEAEDLAERGRFVDRDQQDLFGRGEEEKVPGVPEAGVPEAGVPEAGVPEPRVPEPRVEATVVEEPQEERI
jgi:uncharacterized integral membrane protein